MKEKISYLIDSIENNSRITKPFKYNLAVLINDLVRTLPDYDYTHFGEVLSNIEVVSVNDSKWDYSSFNSSSNTIVLNCEKIDEDRVDMEHIFLKRLLSICTHKEEQTGYTKGFNDGMSEAITLLVIGDDGLKKNSVLEYAAVSLFSKIVDPEVLIDAYMKNDMSLILENLSSYGISEEDFKMLLHDISNIGNDTIENNQSFANAQKRMCYMYGVKMFTEISRGTLSKEDIDDCFFDFSELMIKSKSELISLYPKYDFSHVVGLEWNKDVINETKKNLYENLDNVKYSSKQM